MYPHPHALEAVAVLRVAELLREAERERRLPRTSLRRRLAYWLRAWAEKLEAPNSQLGYA
ncbi:hypothetical protein Mlute_02241 [Meiothermus luteus]|jgi:hypothetical protein|uniref:Uncharacterized protein n=1 Tax=Meiothermus luteus TaxID=2026184 RepID=A0A399EF57_9DEIN|nr:hypothetical protein [Meiothermus luteus]RIH83274.1 hypothetical protein Mlute_02241 [Meiothermus luteus]RMH56130.1 MAG: hypothetical protein D6684_06055 [Deinococcota bacterium]